MPKQDSTRWWYAAEASVALAVVAMPLCLGGAPAWSLWVLAGCAHVALLTWLIGAWRHRRRLTWHLSLLLPLSLSGVAVLSLVPLPPGLLALVSPVNAELREFALVPLGLDGPRPLTLDAPSTWRALARLLSLGALLFVSLQLGRLEAVRRRLLVVVAGVGGVVAVVGFAHLLSGTEALFGLWRFHATLPLLSFFGNTNHLAAFLALSGTVALALALDAGSREASIGWGALALTCGIGVFLSYSRGGIASFVVTWAMGGALQLARRQGGLRSVIPWLVIGATVLLAVGIASEQLFERLASVSSVEKLQKTKLELWPMFWSGARPFERAGMGLGAYELGFTKFQTAQLDVSFTHPENIVLQQLSELGLPLSLLLALLSAVVAVRLVRQARGSVLEPVLLLAIAGAVLHDVFDFAFELQALPTSVAVVLGLCAGREGPGLVEPSRRMVHRGAVALAAVVLLLEAVALIRGRWGHREAEQHLTSLALSVPSQTLRPQALEAIDRHPADWLLYSIVAHSLSREGEARESLAWVNRVLFLRPADPGAHVAAGRALLRLDRPTQALLEFKAAWALGDSTSFQEGLVLAARLGHYDRLLTEDRGMLTRAWEGYRVMGKLPEAQALLDAVVQLPPSQAVLDEARELAVWHAQALGQPALAVERIMALPPEVQARPELVLLAANVLAQVGRLDEAVARLEGLVRKEPQNLGAAASLVALLAQQGRRAEAREALNRTRPFANGAHDRAALFQQEAELWVLEERWPRALDALQSASRIEPQRADLKYRIAQIYERMGSLHSALEEVRHGRLLDTPQGAAAQDAWVTRLETALAGSTGD